MAVKKCTKSKILNQTTGRCVKRSGALGKAILQLKKHKVALKHKKSPKKRTIKRRKTAKRRNRSKKCKKSQVLNRSTNRCVKRSGKIGQAILKRKKSKSKSKSKSKAKRRKTKSKQKKRRSGTKRFQVKQEQILTLGRPYRPLDNQLAEVMNRILSTLDLTGETRGQEDWGLWRIGRKLANGKYGVVYTLLPTIGTSNIKRVVKVQKYNHEADKEVRTMMEINQLFQRSGMSQHVVPIERYGTAKVGNKKYHYIVMNRFDRTINEVLHSNPSDQALQNIADQIGDILDVFRKNNISHGDFHTENVGLTDDGQVITFDFGYVHPYKRNEDLNAFIETMGNEYNSIAVPPRVRNKMKQALNKFYR